MTALAITPNWKNKSAKFRGTIAAGEHVAVTIQNDDGSGSAYVTSTQNLRLNVISPATGRLLATFPPPAAEGETPETWDDDTTPLSCTLNLNTVQMLMAVHPGETRNLLFVLDDYESKTLYFKDMCEVTHWPRRVGEEEPLDLDGYRDFVEETERRLSEFSVRLEELGGQVEASAASAAASASDAADSADSADRALAAAQSAASTAQEIASGKADLVDGKVPSSQLPAYVDDVLEFATLSDFPSPGMEGKIYVAMDTNKTYRWSGTQYTEIANPTLDSEVTKNSANGVKSSGIWSAIWGALAALPTGFSSLYDWVVDQLAGKASKSDATLTERGFTEWVCNPAKVLYGDPSNPDETAVAVYKPNGQDVWALSDLGSAAQHSTTYMASRPYDPVATSLTFTISDSSFITRTVTATRTALQGYQLGSQTDKPLASEAEAEALRNDKLDKSGGTMTGTLTVPIAEGLRFGDQFHTAAVQDVQRNKYLMLNDGTNSIAIPIKNGTAALAAANPTAGNLAALDSNGNPTDSGVAAGDLLTIVALTNSAETMASILARLNTINAAHKHVFFDCSGIDVNPRLYLCTIMIDATANAVRVYDQVTGKLYIGPYDAAETIGEVFAKAVDAYHSITVSAVTLDGVTVTGQTVTIREGTDATAPVYATATITDGAPVTFVVPKGMIYFLEITDTLANHFGPRVTSGAKQGIATADAAVTFTYYDAEHIDVSEITTFAKLQEALTWFGTNATAARNNLVGIEIADTWTATNGTVYDNPRVVWDVHYFEDENGVSHLGALMGTKYCSHNDVQFDAAEGEECNSSTETTAEADVYYYGLALGETSKTAANLTLLELSTGTALPYANYAKIYKSAIRDTTRNSLQYGYNNWRDSAYRQYLNSDAAAGQWWGATHIGDVAPSQISSVRGFMAGCSAALLAAAKKVKVATWPNYITDGPNQITTLYETLDTFFLPSVSEVYGDVNRNGGASVEGELSPYWQARTGYTAPNNASTSTRIIYRELPVGSTARRSAANVRLRSANRGSSNGSCYVTTSGQVLYGYAYDAGASVPACVIY